MNHEVHKEHEVENIEFFHFFMTFMSFMVKKDYLQDCLTWTLKIGY